ncbi:MAG: prolipoprotein diacylglyceryl transferase [Patescibacteria group bacterium]|nr:MAG: prolipoprotein diacylglyceryl transferase [Patescibacteria group bacterium]
MSLFSFFISPSPVAFNLGPLLVYWYGLVMVLAIVLALLLSLRLARLYNLSSEKVIDIAFYLIIFGFIGARLYEVILEWPYYLTYPSQIPQIWRGGLAIHGALLGGLLGLWFYCRRFSLNLWQTISIFLPGVALGQAIGRWGNWFNQELFGLPTNSSWGIFINPINRPLGYEAFAFFHPTFLYESLGCLLLTGLLVFLVYKKHSPLVVIASYLAGYGLLRFFLEFIKIDYTPILWGLRWPQIISLMFILFSLLLFYKTYKEERS